MSLAKRSVTSAGWNIASNWSGMLIQFVRLVLLARWLPVEVFGVYALASSIVTLSVKVADFGMSGAFIHRAPETEDEDRAAATQFTFRMSFTLIWATILATGTLLFAEGQLRIALLALTAIVAGLQFTSTPSLILLRRVTQQRTAAIRTIVVIIATPIMLALAWYGFELWALIAANAVTLVVNVIGLYLWRPVWNPHFAWEPPVMRYFLRFGRKNFLSSILYDTLDRIDDIWVGFFLGPTALGFYSRAYSLATYPRKILAMPVNWVVGGTYSELKGDRARLSKAFFTSNALLIRSGFFLAGLLALIAPEFINLLFGEKWMPMLTVFRLMLVFTLLDPIKVTISSLIGLAGGKPEQVAQARFIQLIVLIAGLFTFGSFWGIEGVAISVNLMLVVGVAILLWKAKTYVDFSLKLLFLAPGIALGMSVVAGAIISKLAFVEVATDLQIILVKSIIFTVIYLPALFLLEPHLVQTLKDLLAVSRPKRKTTSR